ncbi:hypothetical protein MRX96_005135 [Rhipicephalus microplus]
MRQAVFRRLAHGNFEGDGRVAYVVVRGVFRRPVEAANGHRRRRPLCRMTLPAPRPKRAALARRTGLRCVGLI